MKILWDERAWEEYLSWQTEDKRTLKRLNTLIRIPRTCYYKQSVKYGHARIPESFRAFMV